MKPNNIKQLDLVLSTDTQLKKILAKAKLLKGIQEPVHHHITELLQQIVGDASMARDMTIAIHVLSFNNGKLKLLCNSSAVATRLRYLIPELIQRLHTCDKLPKLETIELKTGSVNKDSGKSKKSSPPIPLSPTNERLLKKTLQSLSYSR